MKTEPQQPSNSHSQWGYGVLVILLTLVTLMTNSPLDRQVPGLAILFRIAGYLFVFGLTLIAFRPVIRDGRANLSAFLQTYRFTLIPALILYFLGLVIGALHGPDPGYALHQTASDAVVFVFALATFGWLVRDLPTRTVKLLRTTALFSILLFVGSFIIYLGNVQGLWAVNVYNHPLGDGTHRMLMNGPFTHSNHLAYVLMMGSLSAASLAAISKKDFDWTWWIMAGTLAVGVAITFGRGAMLGTAVGVIAIMFTRHRRLAWLLLVPSLSAVLVLTLGGMGAIHLPAFIPKVGFAGRSSIWKGGIEAIIESGFMGLGSGQAIGTTGWSMHNFFLEQLGEGGVLTLLGVILWLALPIWKIRTSRLAPRLAWSIVGMMLGLMVHGIFWSQFLNGLRILTLVYVCLWTALGTQRGEAPETSPA